MRGIFRNIRARYRYIIKTTCIPNTFSKEDYFKYAKPETIEINLFVSKGIVPWIISVFYIYSKTDEYWWSQDRAYELAKAAYPNFYIGNRQAFDIANAPHYQPKIIIVSLLFVVAFWMLGWFLYKDLASLANIKVQDGKEKDRKMNERNVFVGGHAIFGPNGQIIAPVQSGTGNTLHISANNYTRPELKESLDEISKIVGGSDNDEAKQIWEMFIEEIQNKKRKGVLKSAWNSLVTILPDVAQIASATAEIGKLFL